MIFAGIFLSVNSYGSCLFELNTDLIAFQYKKLKKLDVAKLSIVFPKEIEGWGLSRAKFEYRYDQHHIDMDLGVTEVEGFLHSEIQYAPEFSRSVAVEIRYKDPSGECEKYIRYKGGRNA